MGIKQKIKEKLLDSTEEDEFPDEFEPKKDIKNSEDELKNYIKRNVQQDKDPKESDDEIEEEELTEESIQPQVQVKQSNFTNQLTIHVDTENFERTKGLLKEMVEKNYKAFISTEKVITKNNVDGVNKLLKYLAQHEYDTIIVASKVEPVFND